MPNATVVVAGRPDWAESIAQIVKDYTIKPYRERASGYVARLADDGAAMIVVDGDGVDWRFWTTTPKSSSATRRIPIVVVSADSGRRAEALIAGADFSITPEDVTTQLPRLVNDHARVLDPAVIEQLDCECLEGLPAMAAAGIEKFNAGEYYPQHDLFEALWMATEGPVRNLYQAILQVGIAYYQITRGNHRGALKMLLRSVQWLSLLPEVCQGVDVKQLREDSYRVRAELERMPPGDIDQFDRALLKPVRYAEK